MSAADGTLADAEFLAHFEAGTLPLAAWTHRAHVRVAYLYARAHGGQEGLRRMREGIRAYNQAQGVPETPDRGYHETLTVAWFRLVASRATAAASWPAFADENPDLLDQLTLGLYYTPAYLGSTRARAAWLEPDRAPLPVLAD